MSATPDHDDRRTSDDEPHEHPTSYLGEDELTDTTDEQGMPVDNPSG